VSDALRPEWDLEGLTQRFSRQWWTSGISTRFSSSRVPGWMRSRKRRAQHEAESDQVIRTALLRAQRTYDVAKGAFSTYAAYAVVEDLKAWIAALGPQEVPVAEYFESDRPLGGDDASGFGTPGLYVPMKASDDPAPSPDADERQTRSSASAAEEAVPSASEAAPLSSKGRIKYSRRPAGTPSPRDSRKQSRRARSEEVNLGHPWFALHEPHGHAKRLRPLPIDASKEEAAAWMLRLQGDDWAARLVEQLSRENLELRHDYARLRDDAIGELARDARNNPPMDSTRSGRDK
jgi:hypothetical protein